MTTKHTTVVPGGYTLVTPIVLANLLSALELDKIAYRDGRAFLSLLLMLACRQAANASSLSRRGKKEHLMCFSLEEIQAFIGGVGGQALKDSIAALKRAGLLLDYSDHSIILNPNLLTFAAPRLTEMNRTNDGQRTRRADRPIPVPRRMLKYLTKCPKPARFKGILAYVIRGLSFGQKGTITTTGSVKNGWIAKIAGIGLSTAKTVRQWLIANGWMTADTQSSQHKLNRTGAYFSFTFSQADNAPESAAIPLAPVDSSPLLVEDSAPSQLAEAPCRMDKDADDLLLAQIEVEPEAIEPDSQPEGDHQEAENHRVVSEKGVARASSRLLPIAADEPLSNPAPSAHKLRPLPPQFAHELRPPYIRQKPSYESKNQNLSPNRLSDRPTTEGSGVYQQTVPSFHQVMPEDLKRLDRLEQLYTDAVLKAIVPNSSLSKINFVAAAIRGVQVESAGKGDAVRIFVGIVRQNRMQVISNAQEEQARRWILHECASLEEFAPHLPIATVSPHRSPILPQRPPVMRTHSCDRPTPTDIGADRRPPCQLSAQLVAQMEQNRQTARSIEPEATLPTRSCGLFQLFQSARQRLRRDQQNADATAGENEFLPKRTIIGRFV